MNDNDLRQPAAPGYDEPIDSYASDGTSSASPACSIPDETIERLRGQLQNCVNYLERAKRKHPHDGGNYAIAIEAANKVLYETLKCY